MSPDDSQTQRVVANSDEDWKERVKAEDAALDRKLASEAAPAAGSKPAAAREEAAADTGRESLPPLPPPTFSTIVALLSTQAMVALGLVANPATDKMELQPELAKHFIDMLAVLEEKTRRNLLGREADLLENSLHQLRMAYVEVTEQIKP